MPYCPKCDMEFVEGIKVCSDCGGPLVESKEVAEAIKKKEQEEQPTEKVKLRLMFTGGSELSDTQIVFLNKFLTTQPKNKKLKLVFIEEN